jgi:hypothetical protein
MFLDCLSVTAFWNRSAKILHELLGPQQLANYLLVLVKTTIPEKYLSTKSIHRHTSDCLRVFRRGMQYRLYIEMHDSLWNIDLQVA